MEDYYVMEAVGKKFRVVFDTTPMYIPDHRAITTCVIIEEPGKSVYSGATMRKPSDAVNIHIARRWAFKRAVMEIFLIWTVQKKTSIDFNHFWQFFRLGLAKNELYLKDRKESNYG